MNAQRRQFLSLVVGGLFGWLVGQKAPAATPMQAKQVLTLPTDFSQSSVTTYAYDARDRLTSIVDGPGATVTYYFNSNGDPCG